MHNVVAMKVGYGDLGGRHSMEFSDLRVLYVFGVRR